MSVCMTCRGEYISSKCLCPFCNTALGDNLQRCRNCGRDVQGRRLCPRCGSDVAVWERERITLTKFLAQGGFLGLGPAFVVALLAPLWWGKNPMPAYNHFASILAILFSLAVFMTLFAIRYTLRERRWAAEVQTVRGVSSVYWIAGFFLLGLGAAMVVFIIYMLAIPQVSNPIANLSLMMLFAAAYSLASAGFAAGIDRVQHGVKELDNCCFNRFHLVCPFV